MGDNFITDLKLRFRSGSVLTKLIYINIGVFIVVRLAALALKLFGFSYAPFLTWLEMPSSPIMLLHRPWTLITYMFLHYGFLHIIFNMLWLYWFGQNFLQFLNPRQLGGLYVLGGIAGGMLYFACYNLLPYFHNVSASSFLLGASAAVMAIVFAISFYQKDYVINLLFIGRVKLIYLAIASFLIDLLAITSDNAGGHIAHIGGALFGIWFATSYMRGHDLTAPMNRLIDKFVNLFRRRPKLYVSTRHSETDYEYNARKHREQADIDEILDKLKRSGYESLSSDEKRRLFDASKK